jgi:hypothetical protein
MKLKNYEVIRFFENDNIIIYKRLFKLSSTDEQRYFEVNKKDNMTTGKGFKTIAQAKRYIKNLK